VIAVDENATTTFEGIADIMVWFLYLV
jgi:hypothetical protein